MIGGLLLLLLLPAPPAAADDRPWKVIETSPEGFEIALRETPGEDLPAMRGRGMLRGDILHLLAILLDAERAPEWAQGATRAKTLERKGPLATLVYTFTELRWPVSDRDVITRGALGVRKPGESYRLEMKAEPDALAKKEGVIRLRVSDAHFQLEKKGANRVWLEYVVHADPGGRLPSWLVRWASKSIPLDTLRNLQKQLDKTRDRYAAEITALRALDAGTLR
jgi:hypothetical protein